MPETKDGGWYLDDSSIMLDRYKNDDPKLTKLQIWKKIAAEKFGYVKKG